MKYFRIERKLVDSSVTDERLGPPNKKTYPQVSIKNLQSDKLRNLFSSGEISKTKLISKQLPVLDYFICFQGTYKIEYDWILLDIYYIDYNRNFSKIDLNGWLISERLKSLLITADLKIGIDHTFHPAKLRYQGKYLDYYLLQYVSPSNSDILCDQIKLVSKTDSQNFEIIPENSVNLVVNQIKYDNVHDDKYLEYSYSNYYDVLFTYYHRGTIISERLKNLIEEHDITGVDIKDWDSIRLSFQSDIPKI